MWPKRSAKPAETERMRDWLKRWRTDRTLMRRAIPDPLWALTLARFPFLGWRPPDDVAALRDLTTLFLGDKEFTGAHGLTVDDEMAVAIAAQACLPALKLGLSGQRRAIRRPLGDARCFVGVAWDAGNTAGAEQLGGLKRGGHAVRTESNAWMNAAATCGTIALP